MKTSPASLLKSPSASLDSLDRGGTLVRDTNRRNEYLIAPTTLESLKRPCIEYRRCNSRLCPSCDSPHQAAQRRRLHGRCRRQPQSQEDVGPIGRGGLMTHDLTGARDHLERGCVSTVAMGITASPAAHRHQIPGCTGRGHKTSQPTAGAGLSRSTCSRGAVSVAYNLRDPDRGCRL